LRVRYADKRRLLEHRQGGEAAVNLEQTAVSYEQIGLEANIHAAYRVVCEFKFELRRVFC